MSRTKEQLAVARKLLKKPKGKFQQIDLTGKNPPVWMTRAFQNNRYCVMVNDNELIPIFEKPAIKIMVQRHDDLPFTNHWREMQNIKNELFGKEAIGIEFYPPESALEDHANIYWMWIVSNNMTI